MRKFVAIVVLASSLAACRPVSTGPFHSYMALERWHRADPANEHTMTALVTMHRDERLPSWRALDAQCSVSLGNWAEQQARPPSYGTVRMQLGDRREVRWAEDPYGETRWEDANEALAWDSGDALRVVVEGAEAPGFTIDTVVPPLVELTSHDLRALAANALHVSRSQPLELRWAPTQGSVYLLFLQFKDGTRLLRQRSVSCVFPAEPGEVSVSTDVLGQLLPSSPELGTNIYFGGGGLQTFELDGVDVEVVTFKNEVARIQID